MPIYFYFFQHIKLVDFDAFNENQTVINSERVLQILDMITPPLDDICHSYDWAFSQTSRKCGKEFGRILTEDGMCYTYNLLDRNELFKNKT